MEEFEDMSFCTHCGGELEDNCTLDVHDCIICNQSLHEIGEGYVLPNEQKGVCPECYENIPDVILTEEEKKEEEKEEKYRKENPLRMIAPSQLAGKTIQRSYHVEWNGALVTHTTDNCICVSYSNYNQFNGVNENGYLKTLEDYYRLC